VPAVLVAATVLILVVVNRHYRIDRWLFWSYAQLWGICGAWAFACTSAGHLLLRRRLLPLREHLMLSLATGVVVFAALLFGCGLLGLLGPVFFVAGPLVLALAGGWPLVRYLRRAWRHRRAFRGRSAAGLTPARTAALIFGIGGILLLYANILIPENIAYDSRWYHLGIAEHYAAGGRVARFPEGWFMGAYPHLASLLYTWAFLIPGNGHFTRIELAAHLEFTLFLATLVSIPLLVEWLVPRARAPMAWAALFLFPGILLYDSTLNAGADHVLAFWAIPILLTLRRVLRTRSGPDGVLFGVMLAGAVLTKYQAVYLLVVPCLVLATASLRAAVAAPNGRRARELAGLLAAAAASLVVSGMHWLKNLLWYGDPLYPMLRAHLAARPWVPGTNPAIVQPPEWRATGPLWERARDSLEAAFTFSFVPHDWITFHGKAPVFGFLFTVTIAVYPFLRGARRLWLVAAATMAGVFVWYWTYHQDRYLQALLPWMAACTAAVLLLVWRVGPAARVAVAALVGVQIVWGGDVYFLPTHAMLGTTPIKPVVDHLSQGFRKNYRGRFEWQDPFAKIGPLIPAGSTVLIHERHERVGLRAKGITDAPGTQAGICYTTLGSPAAVHHHLKGFGVTHLLWATGSSRGWDRFSNDLVFFDFALNHGAQPQAQAGFTLAAMPREAPAARTRPARVAIAQCRGVATVPLAEVDAALGRLDKMFEEGLLLPRLDEHQLRDVSYVLAESACAALPLPLAGYQKALTRGAFGLWVPGPTAARAAP
jgi:hypothetical protein